MDRIFLTRDPDPQAGDLDGLVPLADRVGLTEVTKEQRWTATYAIGDAAAGASQRQGIIYVRQAFRRGGRFHYAIVYDIRIVDGRIGGDSDIWMNAIFRSRKVLPHKLPLSEWFSHQPIRVKPSAGTSDPVLLGIEEDPAAPGPF